MSQEAISQIGLSFNVSGLSEVAQQINSVSNNFESLNKINEVVKNGMNSLSVVAGKLSEEFTATAEATKTVGSNMSKYLKNGITLAGQSVKAGVQGIGKTFSGLVKTAKATGTAVTAGLGAIGLALNGITQVINLVSQAFSSFGKVDGVGTLSKDFQNLSETINKAFGFITKFIAVLGAPAIKVFSGIIDNIKKVFQDSSMIDRFASAIGFVQTALSSVVDIVKQVYSAYVSMLQPLLASGYDLFQKVKDKIVEFNDNFKIVETVVGAAKITLDTFLKTLGGIGQTISKVIAGDWNGAWQSAKDTVSGVGEGVVKVFTQSTETGAQVIQTFQEELEKNTANALEGLKNAQVKADAEKTANAEITLAQQISNLQEYIALQKRVANETITDEKKRAEKLKELDKSYYSQKLSMEQSAYQKIIQNNGKITDKSIKSQNDLEKQIIATQKAYDKLGEAGEDAGNKTKVSWQGVLSNMMTVANNLVGIWQSTLKTQEADLSAYDKKIEEVKAKWDALEEEKKEKDASDSEERIANLEEELERSLKANDQMSAKAIKIKLDELKKKKKIEDEEAEFEKQKNYEIAMAEYEKELAEYNNKLEMAKQEKEIAIATAKAGFGTAVMQAAVGFATSFGQLGPIAGPIVGAIVMASTIGLAAANMAKSIESANAGFAQAQAATPPTAPTLAYGTGGMDLSKVGGYAVVGEAGPELVRQKAGGDLEVVSAERTKEYDRSGGDVINLNVYVNEMVTEEIIFNFINKLKSRNLNYVV